MGNLCGKCFRPAGSRDGQLNATSSVENGHTSDKSQEQDPRMPLTVRQKFQISKSWKAIERALTPTAVSMFVKLFEANEELLNLFQNFRNLKSKDEQRQSEELADHATNVMASIHNSIFSLDSIETFLENLKQIGAFHYKINDFKPEYFWKIEQPFLEAVKETLDYRYTENMESIYKITIKLILETLVLGYEDGRKAVEANQQLPTREQLKISS